MLTQPDHDSDSIYYPCGDDMGESGLQFFLSYTLVELLKFYFECSGRDMLVSANQHMYWVQGDPSVTIVPDVYVIAEETLPAQSVDFWQTWEHDNKPPCLAIEIVARDPKRAAKDYDPQQLLLYQDLGVSELLRYDPHCGPGRKIGDQRRQILTMWVRDQAGKLIEQPASSRMRSLLFDFWWVHVPARGLMLGTGPEGRSLWLTKAQTEARRAEHEARRAEEEARRAEDAEARAAALQSELTRLRAQLADK